MMVSIVGKYCCMAELDETSDQIGSLRRKLDLLAARGDDGFENVESVEFRPRFPGHKLLEYTKNWLDLIVCDNVACAARNNRGQQPSKCRYIAS